MNRRVMGYWVVLCMLIVGAAHGEDAVSTGVTEKVSIAADTVSAETAKPADVEPGPAHVMAAPMLGDGLYAWFKTSRGRFICLLEYEKVPLTVCNFVGLAEGTLKNSKPAGTPFYDGLKFHRVVKQPSPFVIQGGCPMGNGMGGPGYKFPDEIYPGFKHDKGGLLSMANSGPGTNGSQFFVTLGPAPWLNGRHAIFGRVVEGMDVVNAVQQGDTIEKVEIVRVGDKAKAFKPDQAMFEKLVGTLLYNNWKRGQPALR